ncbi:hypothetical protein AB0392_32335 [Nonomuraea angiospora]|uniref:hypothetical protein n=1 Tax=Nonomuraea angiospora TaxID=46172 RepID=UPI0034505BF7
MTYVHTDGRPAGARITPDTHPGRWLAKEVALFRQSRCSYDIGSVSGRAAYCGDSSDAEADFGHCREHALAVEDGGGANYWHGLGEDHTDPTLRWTDDASLQPK